MDAVQLQLVTFARKGTLFSIRNPDKLSIYEQRRHFDESLHLRQIVYSTLSQLEAREQSPEFRDCKHH